MKKDSIPATAPKRPTFRQRIRRQYKKRFPQILVLALIAIFIAIAFAPRIFVTVKAGEKGVLFRYFTGTQTDKVYTEGLTILAPFDTLFHYNVRLQQVTRTFDILSNDGLTVKIECSIRYRAEPEKVAVLHVNVGPNYLEKVIIPEFSAAIRDVIGHYRPDELYALDRRVVQQEILNIAIQEIELNNIKVDDFLLMNIELPLVIQAAIQRKLTQEQLALEYQYKVQTAVLEAKRKKQEAIGIKDFQTTVVQGISDSYLKWRGIEATLELARSNNAKVVVVGGGSSGLPLILNLDSVATDNYETKMNAAMQEKMQNKPLPTEAVKEEVKKIVPKTPPASPLKKTKP